MRVRALLAGGGILLLGALAIVLLQSAPRLAGANHVLPSAFTTVLAPGQRACQAELIPGDTARIGARIGTYGRPGGRLDVTATAGGRTLARGSLAPGWHQGDVTIPVSRIADTRQGVVCLVNRGGGRIAIAGSPATFRPPLSVDGRATGDAIRLEYLRPGRETWVGLYRAIAHRMSLARPGFIGSWLPVVLIVLMLGVAALAAATVIRAGEDA